ncbi:MAG TPA: glycine oxidase ThiO [Gammaproteobacteria bacterium]|nr:glycine oxidase ThiO [Gammaproteobacteria bacterium]
MVDCVVIGGGLIGMLSAWELRRSGLSVTIVEQGPCGMESSWAGGGILSPLYPWRYADAVTALAYWSQAHYPAFIQHLHEQTGIDPQLQKNGLLILDMEQATSAANWAQCWGYRLERLDADGIRYLEPALGTVPDAALWLPDIAHVRNPRLLKALKESLINQSVEIREHSAVKHLAQSGGRVQGVVLENETLSAANVLVAGGAWSGKLLATTGLDLPVRPVRGQMILYRGEPGLVSRIVLSQDRYVIARRDGRVLVGSTLEETGFDRSTTESAGKALAAEALRLIPALVNYDIERHWAGLRPGSPEGIPYIGAHPEITGLYVNSGHFRNGVVLGLASSRLLADILLEREPIVPVQPYEISIVNKRLN